MKSAEFRIEIGRNEQRRIADMLGLTPGQVSLSVSPWGTSLYAKIDGVKVRFSDHDTSRFSGRHLDEVHLPIDADLDTVTDAVYRFKPENYEWSEETVIVEAASEKILRNNWHGGRILKVEEGEFTRVSKKSRLPLYQFFVTFEKGTLL